jgi:hypothetical protein
VLLVCTVYSEIALSRKPSGIGHMYIYTFLLRMADAMTSQNIGLSVYSRSEFLKLFFDLTLPFVFEQDPCPPPPLNVVL